MEDFGLFHVVIELKFPVLLTKLQFLHWLHSFAVSPSSFLNLDRIRSSFRFRGLRYLCSAPEIFIIGTDLLDSGKFAVWNGVFGVYRMATGFI